MAQGEQMVTLLMPHHCGVMAPPRHLLNTPSCPQQGCATTGSSRPHHLLRQHVMSPSRVCSTPHPEFVGFLSGEHVQFCSCWYSTALVLSHCLDPLVLKPKHGFWWVWWCPGNSQPSHIHVRLCVCEGAASHAPLQSLNKPKKVLDSSKLTRAILETLTCTLSIFLSLKRAPR